MVLLKHVALSIALPFPATLLVFYYISTLKSVKSGLQIHPLLMKRPKEVLS